MAKQITVAVLSMGTWGRRSALNLCKNRRFKLISAIGNFREEVWRYAEQKAPFEAGENVNEEIITKKLVEHGLVPSMEEAEGEDTESPEAHKKTVDIAIVDMELAFNVMIVTELKYHVRICVLAHAANLIEKKELEELGAQVECPDIDAADNIVSRLSGIEANPARKKN